MVQCYHKDRLTHRGHYQFHFQEEKDPALSITFFYPSGLFFLFHRSLQQFRRNKVYRVGRMSTLDNGLATFFCPLIRNEFLVRELHYFHLCLSEVFRNFINFLKILNSRHFIRIRFKSIILL